MKVRVLVTQSCLTHGTLSCSPWNSPGTNTGVGSHSLLPGIFPTWGLNLDLLHCRWKQVGKQVGKGKIFFSSRVLIRQHCHLSAHAQYRWNSNDLKCSWHDVIKLWTSIQERYAVNLAEPCKACKARKTELVEAQSVSTGSNLDFYTLLLSSHIWG